MKHIPQFISAAVKNSAGMTYIRSYDKHYLYRKLKEMAQIPCDDFTVHVFDGENINEYTVEQTIIILHQLILIDKIYDKEQRKEKNHVRHF